MYCLHVLKVTVSALGFDQLTTISLVLPFQHAEIFSTVFCDFDTEF